MEENTVVQTETTPVETVEQITPDTEPVIEQTTQTQEPETEIEKTSEEKTEPVENIESIQKALKDTKAELTRIQQERAKERKEIEQRQFEQQKVQVESGTTQLKQEYDAHIQQMKSTKAQLTAQALAELQENGDIQTYTNYLAQLDAQYEEAKKDLDGRYQYVESELQKQQRELSTQATQRIIAEFKATESEFCATHPKVIEAYLSKGYDPQDLPAVKELLEIALSERDSIQTLTSENNEAKGKLQSSAFSGGNFSDANHIFTREEIKNMSASEYLKNEKWIFEQTNKGLIK